MNMLQLLIEAAGWAGALLILASYALLSSGRLDGRSVTYQWMNVVGAAGFIINSGYNGAIPSATLNVAWAAIGLHTLWRVRQRAAD